MNTKDGTENKNNLRFEVTHFSFGKDFEKMKNAKGAMLVATKLILTENNLQEGSLNI
jgi:hypothetical protein